jgi:hypothetical protein
VRQILCDVRAVLPQSKTGAGKFLRLLLSFLSLRGFTGDLGEACSPDPGNNGFG